MNILKKKPGVVLLPVSVVLIVFITLLVMLIGQKQSNNALVLEYKASRLLNILQEFHANGEEVEPSEVDENITGFGVYNGDLVAVSRYGTAPEALLSEGSRESITFNGNRSITIIRPIRSDWPPVNGEMMYHGNQNFQERMWRNRKDRPETDSMIPMMQKYRAGFYLEYINSSYIAERSLILLIVILFILVFTAGFILILRLYKTNENLLLQTEHDKQLIQLGEAARTLAHEIRNPLGTLKIQRDLLLRKLPPEFEGNLKLIDRELSRLNTLVERVGDFLKNPLGHPETVDLVSYTSELYGNRNDVELVCGYDRAEVLFDRERLRTVLDNIVNNAIESGGSAVFIIKTSDGETVVSVIDKGPGFSAEALQRVFDPFYTTKTNGTGLGLSIVRRLMESGGGKVSISNLKDGGASVTLVFGERQ